MAKKSKKSAPPQKAAPKYGVTQLAKELGIEAASVRVALRKHNVKKNDDGVYGWDSQSAFKDVVSKLKTPSKGSDKKSKKVAKKGALKKASKKGADEEARAAA